MKNQLPTFKDLLWPTLEELKKRGGSASNKELADGVAGYLDLPSEILDILHKDGPKSEVSYRGDWARTHLKYIDAIDNTSRGIWTITESGRAIQTEREVRELVNQWIKERRKRQVHNEKLEAGNSDSSDNQDWTEALLGIIREMEPDAFERLCQRILRESGFTKVEVTGHSGDGGIDGAGVLRINLISFHVRFQCKRYMGSVSASEMRDFRGAMVGRADKGLFITTGSFTSGAESEASRDGAPAIDLIDGNELCNHLKKLELGVKIETQEIIKPAPEFFKSF